MTRSFVCAGLSIGILLGLGLAAQAPTAEPQTKVVMTGLDNPRGLAFGPEGALYVVEAGRGGTGPCATVRGMWVCYGATGALTRLWHHSQQRVATGLPSYISPTSEVTGAHDVAFQGRSGAAYLTIGFAGDPATRLTTGFGSLGALFGTLVRVAPGARGLDFDDDDWWSFFGRLHDQRARRWRVVTDIAAYETAVNPAGGPFDSNPFGILAQPGAHIVTDAGGNALLRISALGEISTLATFPSRPARTTDAVPTEVVVGPDGAYYVSELTGAPFAAGAARVYRVVPCNEPEVFRDGFKTVIDLDFGPDGSLYVLEHATGIAFSGPGDVIRVAPDGSRSVVVSGLTRPTSLLVDDDGTIYVTNNGVSIGTGQVLRIEP